MRFKTACVEGQAVNRPTVRFRVDGDADSVTATTSDVTTEGDFVIVIENTGAPTHVHLQASDSIQSLVDFDGNNVYVEDETSISVDVKPLENEMAGTITATSSYGSASARVGVVLETGEDPLGNVDVDESLGQPRLDEDLVTEDVEEVSYTAVDYVIGALIGIPIVVIVLWGIVSGNLVVPVLAIMLAMLGGVFVWLFKHHPQRVSASIEDDQD